MFVLFMLLCPNIVLSETGYVSGKITDSRTGKCVAAAWVHVYSGTILKGKSLTGDDGRFYVSRLGAGSYEVVIRKGMVVLYRAIINLPEQRMYNVQLP